MWHGGGGSDEIHLEGESHDRRANYWLEGVGVTGAGEALVVVVQKTMRIPAMVVEVVAPIGKRPTV